MAGRKIGQQDIAMRAGVSVATVSRVLTNAGGISEEVRERVRRVARELGYAQARIAENDIERGAHVVLGQGPDFYAYDAVHQAILQGLTEAAHLVGLRLTTVMRDAAGNIPDKVLSEPSKGRFFIGMDPDDAMVARVLASGSPCVLVNGLDSNLLVDSVSPANYFGGRMIARHLVECGHRRLLYVGVRSRWTTTRRFEGFRDGAHHWGGDDVVVEAASDADSQEDAVFDYIDRLCKAGELTATAIMGRNDPTALNIVHALRANRVRVPEDVAVVGFDDIPIAALSEPSLTTIRVDWRAIGREAVHVMMRRFEAPTEPTRQLQLGVSLCKRQTT